MRTLASRTRTQSSQHTADSQRSNHRKIGSVARYHNAVNQTQPPARAPAEYAGIRGRVVLEDGSPVAGAVIADTWVASAGPKGDLSAYEVPPKWSSSLEYLYEGGIKSESAVTQDDGSFSLIAQHDLIPRNRWTNEPGEASKRTFSKNKDFLILFDDKSPRGSAPVAGQAFLPTHGAMVLVNDQTTNAAEEVNGTVGEFKAPIVLKPLVDVPVNYKTGRPSRRDISVEITAPGSLTGCVTAHYRAPEAFADHLGLMPTGTQGVIVLRLPQQEADDGKVGLWLRAIDDTNSGAVVNSGIVATGAQGTEILVPLNPWDAWKTPEGAAESIAAVTALLGLLAQQREQLANTDRRELRMSRAEHRTLVDDLALEPREWLMVSLMWPFCQPCFDPQHGMGFWHRAAQDNDNLTVLCLSRDGYAEYNDGKRGDGETETEFYRSIYAPNREFRSEERPVWATAIRNTTDTSSGPRKRPDVATDNFQVRHIPADFEAFHDEQYPLYFLFHRDAVSGDYKLETYSFDVAFEDDAKVNQQLLDKIRSTRQ